MTEGMTGRTVVLIVEDEPLIRMDVAEQILDAGMEPVEAANADEALALLEERADIAVVFTDVNMPGTLDGLELADRIGRSRPGIGVIVTSGMVRPAARELGPRTVFMPKPYSLVKLVATIRSIAAF